jgi:hypothetical protein
VSGWVVAFCAGEEGEGDGEGEGWIHYAFIGFVSDGLCEVVILLFVAGWCNMTREIFGYEMKIVGWDKKKCIVWKRR